MKNVIFLFCIILNIFLIDLKSYSVGIGYGGGDYSDMLSADMNITEDSPYYYYNMAQWGIANTTFQGSAGTGYFGFQNNGNGLHSLLMSVWSTSCPDSSCKGKTDIINMIYPTNPEDVAYIQNNGIYKHRDCSVAEGGCFAQVLNYYQNWSKNNWYNMTFRIWQGLDNDKDKFFYGLWVYDYNRKTWKHHTTISVLAGENNAKNVTMSPYAGFIEDYGGTGAKAGYLIRNRMTREKSTLNWNPQKVLHDSEQASRLSSCGVRNDGSQYYLFVTYNYINENSHCHNDLITPNITRPNFIYAKSVTGKGTYNGNSNKLSINWNLLNSNTPQFSYKVKVYDSNKNIIASETVISSEKNSTTLNLNKFDTSNKVTIQITDIYDQKSDESEIKIDGFSPQPDPQPKAECDSNDLVINANVDDDFAYTDFKSTVVSSCSLAFEPKSGLDLSHYTNFIVMRDPIKRDSSSFFYPGVPNYVYYNYASVSAISNDGTKAAILPFAFSNSSKNAIFVYSKRINENLVLKSKTSIYKFPFTTYINNQKKIETICLKLK